MWRREQTGPSSGRGQLWKSEVWALRGCRYLVEWYWLLNWDSGRACSVLHLSQRLHRRRWVRWILLKACRRLLPRPSTDPSYLSLDYCEWIKQWVGAPTWGVDKPCHCQWMQWQLHDRTKHLPTASCASLRSSLFLYVRSTSPIRPLFHDITCLRYLCPVSG